MDLERIIDDAKASLRGHWRRVLLAIGIYALFSFAMWLMLITIFPQRDLLTTHSAFVVVLMTILTNVIFILLTGAWLVGWFGFFLHLAKREPAPIESLFDGFRGGRRCWNSMLTGLFNSLVILGCTLLLIVPGAIAICALSLTYFLLAENPTLSPVATLKRSRELMRGHKTELLKLWFKIYGILIGCFLIFFLLNLLLQAWSNVLLVGLFFLACFFALMLASVYYGIVLITATARFYLYLTTPETLPDAEELLRADDSPLFP